MSIPAYLLTLDFSVIQIGAILAAAQGGVSVLMLATGMLVSRISTRVLLSCAAVLMMVSAVLFSMFESFLPLLAIACLGGISASPGDMSSVAPLEHASLAQYAEPKARTTVFAQYSLVGSLAVALGGLAAGAPDIISGILDLELQTALKGTFVLYCVLAGLMLILYRRVPPSAPPRARGALPLDKSRSTVLRLSGLYALDAFGGGFAIQSLLAVWLFTRFGASVSTVAQIFFLTGLASAASFLMAPIIARRLGLMNTMLGSHLAASICLVAVPFMPSLELAISLLFLRSLLAQIDVPTRTSLLMAIVCPHERAAASSITSVARTFAGATSPVMASALFAASPFGWPLVVGGMLKIGYDLLLFSMFGKVKTPEETES